MNLVQVIQASEAMIAATHKLIDNLHPPTTSPNRLRVALFLSIAEQFEACAQLLRAKMATHAATHVRSMLETLVNMNLLGLKENYVEQMRYKHLKGQKKLLESVRNSEYFPDDSKRIAQKMLDECAPDFDKKHKSGLRPRQIADEMAEAELSDFMPPYLMLCGFTHSDIGVLALRHQGEDTLIYMAPLDDDITTSIFLTAIKVIVQAAEPLSRIAIFPTGCFDSAFLDMNNAWASALAACDA